jgi:hypothetical protein
MSEHTPPWDNERIINATNNASNVWEARHLYDAMVKVRDDYEAELATLRARIAELEAQLAAAWEPVDTIELDWGYQIACIAEHSDGETTLQTTGYSITDPDLQFSIRMPKQYRICHRKQGGDE